MYLFVENLMNLDFSYFCDNHGLVGESFLVDVSLHGELNEDGMIFDFGLFKSIIKKYVNEHVDHKLLLPMLNNNVVTEDYQEGYKRAYCKYQNDCFVVESPVAAYCLIESKQINKEVLTDYLNKKLQAILPSNVVSVEVQLQSDSDAKTLFSYSHGLEKHLGNCQRIAHGHRSIISVRSNNEQQVDIERYWQERWNNKYLASSSHLKKFTKVLFLQDKKIEIGCSDYYLLSYQGSQGFFNLYINKMACELLDSETTVELLAKFVAYKSIELFKLSNVEIRLYEGVGKGFVFNL